MRKDFRSGFLIFALVLLGCQDRTQDKNNQSSYIFASSGIIVSVVKCAANESGGRVANLSTELIRDSSESKLYVTFEFVGDRNQASEFSRLMVNYLKIDEVITVRDVSAGSELKGRVRVEFKEGEFESGNMKTFSVVAKPAETKNHKSEETQSIKN